MRKSYTGGVRLFYTLLFFILIKVRFLHHDLSWQESIIHKLYSVFSIENQIIINLFEKYLYTKRTNNKIKTTPTIATVA